MATVKQKGIIYCTKEQFDTLMSTGSVVIGGQTFTYEDGWQYAVVDKDYVDLTTDQGIEGTKTFVDEANNKSIGINGSGFIYQTGNNSYNISLPAGSGTLATTDDVKKYYRHRIFMYSSDVAGPPAIVINGYLISSRATPYTKQELTGMTPDNFVAFVNKLYGIQGKLVVNTGNSIYVYTELSPRGHFVNMFYIDQQVNLTTGWLVQGNVLLELDNSWSLEHYTPEEI